MPINHRTRKFSATCLVVSLTLIAGPAQAQQWPETPKPAKPLGSEVWVGAPIVGESPCETLANRVCGESRACADQPACQEVQQWLTQEQQERAANENPKRMTHASGQCQEADRDRQRYVTCNQ
jgi:hypothetical protein